jgi:hypothetical protein
MMGQDSGMMNTAIGISALSNDDTGSDNTAIGYNALTNNTNGHNNIAIGSFAASNVSGPNINNIHIGTRGASANFGTIRIGGNTSLGNIFGAQTQFAIRQKSVSYSCRATARNETGP